MSQWVLNSEKDPVDSGLKDQNVNQPGGQPNGQPEGQLQDQADPSPGSTASGKPQLPRRISGWALGVPFLLSAAFFLSRFFAIFAPLPLLLFYFQKGRRWAWAATFSNLVLVGLLGGVSGLWFYFVFVVGMVLILPEMLLRKKSLLKTAAASLLSMTLCGFVVLLAYSLTKHVNLMAELSQTVSGVVDSLSKSLLTDPSWMDPSEIEILKKNLILEFPSAVATFALILVWSNLVILLKVNPEGLLEKIGLDLSTLRKWKAPELLVWPTLLCGFFLLGDFGVASDIALNVFKFLMAVYVIQGLSILSYFLEMWGVKGLFRAAGMILPVVMSAPLVAGLGFFDLWFDFRSKFRQS